MNANHIKIACFGNDGHEYAKEFTGETAVLDSLNYFMAQMDRSEWDRVRQQVIFAGENAMKVGDWRNGFGPVFQYPKTKELAA